MEPYFEKLNQTNSIRVSNLVPNGKVEQTLIYRPKTGTYGRVNFTAAEVFYQTKESGAQFRTESSEPGTGYIIPAVEYEKQFSLHLVSSVCSLVCTNDFNSNLFSFQSEWSVFGVLSLLSIGVPYLLFSASKKKYEAIKSKSK